MSSNKADQALLSSIFQDDTEWVENWLKDKGNPYRVMGDLISANTNQLPKPVLTESGLIYCARHGSAETLNVIYRETRDEAVFRDEYRPLWQDAFFAAVEQNHVQNAQWMLSQARAFGLNQHHVIEALSSVQTAMPAAVRTRHSRRVDDVKTPQSRMLEMLKEFQDKGEVKAPYMRVTDSRMLGPIPELPPRVVQDDLTPQIIGRTVDEQAIVMQVPCVSDMDSQAAQYYREAAVKSRAIRIEGRPAEFIPEGMDFPPPPEGDVDAAAWPEATRLGLSNWQKKHDIPVKADPKKDASAYYNELWNTYQSIGKPQKQLADRLKAEEWNVQEGPAQAGETEHVIGRRLVNCVRMADASGTYRDRLLLEANRVPYGGNSDHKDAPEVQERLTEWAARQKGNKQGGPKLS